MAIIQSGQCDISNVSTERLSEIEGKLETDNAIYSEMELNDAVTEFQRTLITERLQSYAQNWSQAAKALGVDRGNLHRMAKRLGLK